METLEAMDGEWFKNVDQPYHPKAKSWMWKCWLSNEGMLYVPIVLGGPAIDVMLCASSDGARMILSHEAPDACYVEASWLAKEFPAAASTIEKIRANVATARRDDA